MCFPFPTGCCLSFVTSWKFGKFQGLPIVGPPSPILNSHTTPIRIQLSNEKSPGCLGCIGDYTTQYMGIFISQYKDPYKPTSTMESRMVFFVAQLFLKHQRRSFYSARCKDCFKVFARFSRQEISAYSSLVVFGEKLFLNGRLDFQGNNRVIWGVANEKGSLQNLQILWRETIEKIHLVRREVSALLPRKLGSMVRTNGLL